MTTQLRQLQPIRHYQAALPDGTMLRGGSKSGKLPTHVAVSHGTDGALIAVWGSKKHCRKAIIKFRTHPLYRGSERRYVVYPVTQVA